MTARTWFLSFLCAFFGLTVLSYWFGVGGGGAVPLAQILYVTAPLLAFGSSLYALKVYGLKAMYGYPLLFLTLGFGCWSIGELLWVVYEFVVHIDPYPSAADYFYLLAYPFFIAAFGLAIRSGDVKLTGLNQILLFLFGLNAIWITVIVLYFGVYLAYDPGVSTFENAVAMGYGIGDLIIFLACLLTLILAWEYREGKVLNTWMYLFAGFMLTLLADIAFSIYHVQYEAGAVVIRNVLDCLWILGYLYFAFGMFEFAYIIREIQKRLRG